MEASGNTAGPNPDTYYSSVTSLRSMRTFFLLDEFNDIEIITGDIRNAYLTARTKEKIIFNLGREFALFIHVGHLILIKTASYGLKILCVRFHSHLSDALTSLVFFPFIGGYNIWMSDEGE